MRRRLLAGQVSQTRGRLLCSPRSRRRASVGTGNGWRPMLHGGCHAIGLALIWPQRLQATAASAANVRCESDRCRVSVLLRSRHALPCLLESLRLASQLAEEWNVLTSEGDGKLCKVSGRLVRESYFGEATPLWRSRRMAL